MPSDTASATSVDTVILLEHLRVDDNGNDHIKTVGIYRTQSGAEAAVERLKSMPGFRDAPEIVDPQREGLESGFYLSRYKLDMEHWAEGFGLD